MMSRVSSSLLKYVNLLLKISLKTGPGILVSQENALGVAEGHIPGPEK